MITTTWRTKLTLLAGVPLMGTGLMLALTGPGAGATTLPVPTATPAAAPPTSPAAAPPTSPAAAPPTSPAAAPPTSPAAAGAAAPAAAPAIGSAAGSGDNGTVKIHRSTTPVTDRRNEPHVCVFYLDAFGFDAGQSVSWQIKSWPPTGDRTVVASGVLTLDSNGDGHTGDMTLPSGHYKLFWNFTGENGFAKQKVFWVACESTPPPTSPPPSPTTPTSSPPGVGGLAGLPITGWPLALIAAAGAGLLGVGTAAIVAARRRRGLRIH